MDTKQTTTAGWDSATSSLVIIDRLPEGVRVTSIPYESEHDYLYSLYSDLFKSYEGIRPRWAYSYSCEELQAAIDALDERETEPEIPTSGDGWAFTPAA
jgi:hypothetical protein